MYYYVSSITGKMFKVSFELSEDLSEVWDIFLGRFSTEEDAQKAYCEYMGTDYNPELFEE